MPIILSVKNVSKTYQSGLRAVKVLDSISFDIEAGTSVAIVGPSGSGKTTLLGLCAGLDRVSDGAITLNQTLLNPLSEDGLARARNEWVGFIFQNFQLIPTLTALENVQVPLELRGDKGARAKSLQLLDRVGLSDRIDHYPSQLSGGEQQRVAIARAFSNDPKILFADEPTGNLDQETGTSIDGLLFEMNKEKGTTLVIVTHDMELAAKTSRTIRLKGGKIVQ
ncbi:MAG: ABC transporter ATP-binding protein [Cyclobacteriaceae bacterium]|nr:ABC transporter ATP-binding protein [Cyclobacteriaceae bacterium]